MNDNPFAPPAAALSPAPQPVPAATQPYLFIAALLLVSCCTFAFNLGMQWYRDLGGFRERAAEFLPMMTSQWLGGMLLYAAAVLLLVHQQRERHAIAAFRPLAGLLVGFALLHGVCTMGLSVGLGLLLAPLYRWTFEQSLRQLWFPLVGQVSSLAYLGLSCLLPLWLVLRLARPGSPRLAPGARTAVASWQVGLGFALCFGALYIKLLLVLGAGLVSAYDEPWMYLYVLLAALVPAGVAYAAALTRLPANLERFDAGRVLLASVVALLLWGLALLLCGLALALLLAISTFGQHSVSNGLLALALLLGAGLLVLLWPIVRVSLGWFFGEQIAAAERAGLQPSPR